MGQLRTNLACQIFWRIYKRFLKLLAKNMPTVYGSITIKEDVWLGTGAIILPNVTIGEGAVVGAGSVVNKSVLPFTVVSGVPARLIRKLDTRDQI